MKIRQGFVSNSSTTSFCIYGACLEESPKVRKLLGLGKDDENFDYDAQERAEAELAKIGLEVHHGPCDSGTYYIGRSLNTIRDDETGGDFKKSVKEAILKVLNRKTIKCEYHEESFMDG